MNKIYHGKNVNLFCFAISDLLTKTLCKLCRDTDKIEKQLGRVQNFLTVYGVNTPSEAGKA